MKYLAHIAPSVDSPIVSIYDAMDEPQDGYYSLWDLVPMVAKVGYRRRKPHFAFKSGYGHDGKGESVEHSITKYVIYRSRLLHLRSENGVVDVKFDEVSIEHQFNDGLYVADLYARVASDNELFEKGEWVAIEIYKTHRVDRDKRAFFEHNGIAAIELKYWDAISFEHNEVHLQRRIEGWLSRPQYFRWLCNPRFEPPVVLATPYRPPVVITPPSANARPYRSLWHRLKHLFT